ncbi:Putative transmembrane protein [hydrothermal vent metagenome]|uniref:Transmembrane protein n=1 Tax=hydrothermal vent metagenome TaxID=652676 RepID=A0A3B0WE87_9ZZZZ
METIDVIALSLGVAWASGINLYAVILVLGLMGAGGYTQLPETLTVLQDPLVLMAAGIMYFVEFFADKIPGVDSGWDAIHTFIRIPAGAMLAVGAAQGLEINQAAELAAALLGGSLAATSHLTKASTRLVINTSPEPMTNWMASFAEDLAVIGGLWAALNYPLTFILFIVLFVLVAIWLLPKLWRTIKSIVATVRGWFGGAREEVSAGSSNNIIENLIEAKTSKLDDK